MLYLFYIMRSIKLIILLLVLSGSAAWAQVPVTTTINFTLERSYTTSAGVYRADGASLVRTLWRSVDYSAGPHQATWDGLNDEGQAMPVGTYQVKVLTHNVRYVWEGVIGNTSASFTRDVWRGFVGMYDAAFAGEDGFVALGYNEALPALKRFNTKSPQVALVGQGPDRNSTWVAVATDGITYYAASNNSGWDPDNSSYVAARTVSTNDYFYFSKGQDVQFYGSNTYYGILDLTQKKGARDDVFAKQQAITGLAVQKTGNLLAVAHGRLGVVRFFDKISGAALGSLAVAQAGRIVFAPSGDLWVISGGVVGRYHNNSKDLQAPDFQIQNTLPGIINALGVAADPTNDDLVLVADGGSSQQVKAYSRAGVLKWTYGQAGGYATNGPDVTFDKFFFVDQDPLNSGATDRDPSGSETAFISFASDGSFWLGDRGNCRMLHFSANRAYLEQISYIADKHYTTVDPNNPSRIFSDWLEYQVDNTRALQPGDPTATGSGSWKLVKNWAAGVDWARFAPFNTVVTLNNGRTYGQILDHNTFNPKQLAIVELAVSGNLRFTGTQVSDWYDGGKAHNLYANGDLRYWDVGLTVDNNVQKGYRCPLTGFDTNGNPQWGGAVLLGSAYVNSSDYRHSQDPVANFAWAMTNRLPITESGMLVSYNPQANLSGSSMHLGGIQTNGGEWSWNASPGQQITAPDGKGTFPDVEAWGGHNGVSVFAEGRQIVYGYDGQYGTFSSQWMHYYDDGLFIGQFGQTNDGSPQFDDWRTAVPGFANNIATMFMAKAGKNLYVYAVDEAIHGGLHRWRIDGTDNLRELKGAGQMGSSIQIATAPLTLGIAAGTKTATATATPNPSTGVFELAAASPLLRATVLDARGAQVLQLLPTAGQTGRIRCDLSASPAGVYLVMLQTATGSQTLKLVKN